MSYTPSQTLSYSDLDTLSPLSSDLIEDFSSLGEDPEDLWYQAALQTFESCSSDQLAGSNTYPDEQLIGLSKSFNRDACTLSDTAGCGSWMGDGLIEGSSAERSGKLNCHTTLLSSNLALVNQNMQYPMYASQSTSPDSQVLPTWEENPGMHNTTNHAAERPIYPLNGRGNGKDVPPKREIEKHVSQISKYRAEQRSKVFTCDDCGTPCRRSADLKRHMASVHKIGVVYACDSCLHRNRRGDKMKEHCRKRHQQARGSEAYGTLGTGDL